jgi:hypothetical protein
MSAITPDIKASTQSIKGNKRMKKSTKSTGFKKFTPAKGSGSKRYVSIKIKGKTKNTKGVGQGAKYGGC